MSSEPRNNGPDNLESQALEADFSKESLGNLRKGPRYYAGKPAEVVELLTAVEIKERHQVGYDRLVRAVALGHIHAYGRPGRQKYYSAAEIENWLTSVGGRQLRWSEFDVEPLAV